jgi:peroxiredoxin
MRTNLKRLMILTVVLSLAGLLTLTENVESAKTVAKIGSEAPNIVLFNVKNKLMNLKKMNYKKFILVSFSATYCKPCKEEIKEFKKMKSELGKNNIEFLLVFIDKNKDLIIDFKNDNKIDFPILHDLYKMAMGKYGVTSLPTSFLIDKKGIIRYIANGYSESHIEKIKEMAK